jgi:ABC-2 type transport system permease protein
MEIVIPKTKTVLSTLLRADLTAQWRNRKSLAMVVLVPVIILISWKPLIPQFGGTFVLATCITIGLISIGLMGYTNSIARDREKGVFQRLRVGPVPAWCIMSSRLLIQLFTIFILTLLVFTGGFFFDNISLSPFGYALTLMAATVGGGVYLSLGQVIVGRIKNPETVNSTCRLIYFFFIMVGMFGELGVLGDQLKQVIHYSPYGAVKSVLAASMEPSKWTSDTSLLLLATAIYIIIFSYFGIKWFKWK